MSGLDNYCPLTLLKVLSCCDFTMYDQIIYLIRTYVNYLLVIALCSLCMVFSC